MNGGSAVLRDGTYPRHRVGGHYGDLDLGDASFAVGNTCHRCRTRESESFSCAEVLGSDVSRPKGRVSSEKHMSQV
jgi:hypothetical protein